MQLIKSIFLSAFALIALNAHAIDQMYNWNGLEFVTSGNVTHVHRASPESTRLRGGWTLDISDVEPKATASAPLPYSNKGGALAKITVSPSIDPKKVSSISAAKIKDAIKSAAGNPYVAIASIGCSIYCDTLIDWGLDKLNISPDGSLTVSQDDPDIPSYISDGYTYRFQSDSLHARYGYFLTKEDACAAYLAYFSEPYLFLYSCHINGVVLRDSRMPDAPAWGRVSSFFRTAGSSCPSGSSVVNNSCSSGVPQKEYPLQTYIESRYTAKGWDNHWSKLTAAIIADGGNVFTDGTSVSITGPAIVPLSEVTQTNRVNVLPSTTTIAPSGYTGPTESGTQTTVTTTTASNTFNPAPFSTGNSSSGGQSSGPSFETKQSSTSITTVTNNVTNITNITKETLHK